MVILVPRLRKFQRFFKILTQLKFSELFYLFVYRAGLLSGFYRLVTGRYTARKNHLGIDPRWIEEISTAEEKVKASGFSPPTRDALEICSGKYRQFGSEPADLILNPGAHLNHWTDYELGKAGREIEDIKLIWEPARFGWAFVLARAYGVTGDPGYARSFWQHTDNFINANPAYWGPNWTSAQEAAMRIIALAFALPVFWSSPGASSERKKHMLNALAAHASRIPPTLAYARAQNNNHLLIEGVGLFTAGSILSGCARSGAWKRQGWKIVNHCLQKQIEPNGEYCQHSLNYHRLMLQAALWTDTLRRFNGLRFPKKTLERLKAATAWLIGYTDRKTGQAPNLGHNDGALLLPLSSTTFADHRPTAETAACAFLNVSIHGREKPDEMQLWLALEEPMDTCTFTQWQSPAVHGIENKTSRAFIRSYRYKNRPAHADQLHVDLWWRGQNITLDPGTYHYNLPVPWDNGLAGTSVHNTVTIDGQDQMTRISRFLWLDWAQSKIIHSTFDSITAEHDGYRHLGVIHRRTLQSISPLHWQVTDQIICTKRASEMHQIRLNWNFPDGKWSHNETTLTLSLPRIKCTASVEILSGSTGTLAKSKLVRAGELIHGEGEANPLAGWYSPTYAVKDAALSWQISFSTDQSLSFKTTFTLDQP